MPVNNELEKENIFAVDEFEEIRYRKTLLPRWMKVLAGIGVAGGTVIVLALSLNVIPLSGGVDPNTNSTLTAIMISVFLVFEAFFITGIIALIQLIREKKWAIYGSMLAVLSHMGIFVTGIFMDKKIYSSMLFWPSLIFHAAMLISQLAFLIRLILIFRRWLEYKPSPKTKNGSKTKQKDLFWG